MIPRFPQFKRLSIEDHEDVEAYTSKFPSYSDYNFSSLWAWDVNENRELSLLDGNLVVKFTDYASGAPFLSFLGATRPERTASTLLEYCESLGIPPILHLVPESSVRELDSGYLHVAEDRANFDYIYLARDLSEMTGGAYKKKRHCLNAFEKRYERLSFEVKLVTERSARGLVRAIARAWRSEREGALNERGLDYEMAAIERMIALGKTRPMQLGFVFVEGEATSFRLEELSNRTTSIAHFGKTAVRTKGENEYLSRGMARHMLGLDVTYLNWEQDLGIPTLRASKTSYAPSSFLRKFTVARATSAGMLTPAPVRSTKPSLRV